MAEVKTPRPRDMVFGEKLKELRKEYGLSGRSLGALFGISTTHIARLEKNQTAYISDDIILATADTFEIDPHVVYAWAGRLHPDIMRFLGDNPEEMKLLQEKALRYRDELVALKPPIIVDDEFFR